jgi:hypothetical protein
MAHKRRTAREADEQDAAVRGRSTSEKEYDAAERDQARENERMAQPTDDESDAFVTDAEMEAREANSTPQKDEEP